MELCCLDCDTPILDNNIYLIFYKHNYFLSVMSNANMPKLIHVIRGIGIDNKHRNNNDMLNLLPNDAKLLIATGDVRETFEYFSNMLSIKNRFDKIYFYPSRELRYEYYYREKYKKIPLKKAIVFRSGKDRRELDDQWEYADNGRALFEYIVDCGLNEEYEIVWIVKEPNRYREITKKHRNVKFISCFDSNSEDENVRDEYYEALCLSKYIFCCQAFAFARNARKDQVRVQLWHGCGFKSNQLVERHEKKYEYMTVTSQMYSDLHSESFGLQKSQMLMTGLPKNDWLFSPMDNWNRIFDIPHAEKYVFWLPTYRTSDTCFNEKLLNETTGLPIFSDVSKLVAMNSLLKQLNIVLVVKLHPAQTRKDIVSWDLSNILLIENEVMLDNNADVNQLLGHADALISDYSSAAVGYMLLDRPIAFTLDDIDLYHGFHWPKEELRDWLPGEEIYDFDDFVRFVRDVAEGRDTSREKRHRLMPYFHKYTDGNSCARVLEALGITKD